MLNDILRNTSRFIILVLLQVLIIKNIALGIFVNPFIYILFIMMLPFSIPNGLLLLIAFITGLTIDMFYNTMGIHAFACVFMAYCRPTVLRIISPRDGYEFGTEPTLQSMGLQWFLPYSIILVLIHHSVLFSLEYFRFSEFGITFLKIIISSIATIILLFIIQFLFYKEKQQ
ncbi:MAG TPA: rod shape-determining protein MreD [Bacteroidia bacterium]|nr:rod shape-determining protein MreD [Bacteroidia bacterium]